MSLSAFQWLDSSEQVAALAARLTSGQPLFLDTEFMRERTFWARLALIQVNDGSACYLIDPLAANDTDAMLSLLVDRPLVMHGCSEDLEALSVWPGMRPAELRDTQIGAALCGQDMQCSYQKLVDMLLGVNLPKGATRTDWLQRPLSAEQLEYAAHDVEYLPGVYQSIYDQLAELGRLDWWKEECRRLQDDCQRVVPEDELWRQVKGAASLDGPARRRLRVLAAWRDSTARERNLPRSFVLKDLELIAVVNRVPVAVAELSALGLHPSALRRFGSELLAVLATAEQGEIPDPLPGMPEPALRDRIKRLRTGFASIAAEHGLAPEVLCRRRWLEALARDPDMMPEPLTGWRAALIGDRYRDWL
ncbi:MAG: ribonuclease D [Gammaproteobacteria bacterium HGW-Gammaproteobacteria-14]|nr:MAG: ribonuclease D [Gammaproteobacteria bacterium HGW-Gammaproteobacteria-14]